MKKKSLFLHIWCTTISDLNHCIYHLACDMHPLAVMDICTQCPYVLEFCISSQALLGTDFPHHCP